MELQRRRRSQKRVCLIRQTWASTYDVPPIHPIGLHARGHYNTLTTGRNRIRDSPWAIGGPEGGHKAIHTSWARLPTRKHGEGGPGRTAFGNRQGQSPSNARGPSVCSASIRNGSAIGPTAHQVRGEPAQRNTSDIYPLEFDGKAWQALYQELLD